MILNFSAEVLDFQLNFSKFSYIFNFSRDSIFSPSRGDVKAAAFCCGTLLLPHSRVTGCVTPPCPGMPIHALARFDFLDASDGFYLVVIGSSLPFPLKIKLIC